MAFVRRLLSPSSMKLYTLLTTTCIVRNIHALSASWVNVQGHTQCLAPKIPRQFRVVRPLCSHFDKWTDLSFEDLVALLEDGDVQLFDVREPEELCETGAIPGATNIPLDDVEYAFKLPREKFLAKYGVEMPEHTDSNIVFQCLAGYRSNIAMETAQSIGFTKSRNYVGGWEEWVNRNPNNIDHSKKVVR